MEIITLILSIATFCIWAALYYHYQTKIKEYGNDIDNIKNRIDSVAKHVKYHWPDCHDCVHFYDCENRYARWGTDEVKGCRMYIEDKTVSTYKE